MSIEWNILEGICMICNQITEVKHINLYPSGSEGLLCCKKCENELLKFIREKQREFVVKKKEEILKRREGV